MDNVKMELNVNGVNEALALLYVKSQALIGKTLSDIAEMYDKAYNEITAKLNDINAQRSASAPSDFPGVFTY